MPFFDKETVRCESTQKLLALHKEYGIELWCKKCRVWHLVTWRQIEAVEQATHVRFMRRLYRMQGYFIGSLTTLISIIAGYVMGKPWIDKKIAKPTQKPPQEEK